MGTDNKAELKSPANSRIHSRTIKSYVIREGRMTGGQKKALEEQWSFYGLNLTDGLVDLNACFGDKDSIVLEIGFGMGESLFNTASMYPNNGYIGIETHRPGVGRLLQLASDASLNNLKVFMADAIEVLSHNIQSESISVIQVLFPDPWPKKRHHKRRLINSNFIQLASSRLKMGGRLHLATDWIDYANFMKESIESNNSLETSVPDQRTSTKYEKRGVLLGHEITDLAYVRVR